MSAATEGHPGAAMDRCEMHLGDLRANAKACGKPAAWRFPAEAGGFIYACDDCIGAGRRYAERLTAREVTR